MLSSVQPLIEEHLELQTKLSDPALHGNPALAKKLNRRYAELSTIVAAYNQVNSLGDDLAAAKELAKEDEMFAEEVPATEQKLHEANEKLRRLLIPRDPAQPNALRARLPTRQRWCGLRQDGRRSKQ